MIEVANEIKEPDLQRRRIGQDRNFDGHDKDELKELVKLVNDNEMVLLMIYQNFDRIIDKAKQNIVIEVVGQAVLFKVNRIKYSKKSNKLFLVEIEESIDKKY